jgi:hypothetical protein
MIEWRAPRIQDSARHVLQNSGKLVLTIGPVKLDTHIDYPPVMASVVKKSMAL